MIKKSGFSELEIVEIHQQINTESSQHDPNTIMNKLLLKNKNPLTELK